MKAVEIPGGTLLLRDVEQIPERLVRPVRSAATKMMRVAARMPNMPSDTSQMTPEELQTLADSLPDDVLPEMWALNDLLAVALVAEWRVNQPLEGPQPPVTLDSLLDLPKGQYDAVQKAVTPFLSQIMTDFSPSPDPDSPTVPSDASVGV